MEETKNGRPQSSNFLFVNKNSSSKSFSRSDGKDAAEIQSHAQKSHFKNLEARRRLVAQKGSSATRRIVLAGWQRRTETLQPQVNVTTSDFSTSHPTSPSSSSDGSTPVEQSIRSNVSHRSLSTSDAPINRDPNRSSNVSSTYTKNQKVTMDDIIAQVTIARANALPRTNFSDIDCIDPFKSTPMRIDGAIHALIRFTLQIYQYSGNNYKIAFLPAHISTTIQRFPISTVIQNSIHNEAHLYCLLAAISARMKFTFGERFETHYTPERIKSLAAYHLRKHLSSEDASQALADDKQLILDVLFLAVSEMQHKNYDAARKSLAIVRQIYHLLDVENNGLDRWISESAAHVDNQLAMLQNTQPVLPFSFDPGDLLPERLHWLKRKAFSLSNPIIPTPHLIISPTSHTISAAPRPPGLSDVLTDFSSTIDGRMGTKIAISLEAGCFNPTLVPTVSSILDCIEVAKVVWLSPMATCFDAEWLCRKARACLRRLLAFTPTDNDCDTDIDSTHDNGARLYAACTECCRLALLIVMTHAATLDGFQNARRYASLSHRSNSVAIPMWWVKYPRFANFNIPLHEVDVLVVTAAGLILWVLLTSAFAAVDMHKEQRWFLETARPFAVRLRLHTYEDLHAHMACYIYSKPLQEPQLRRLAEMIAEGNRH